MTVPTFGIYFSHFPLDLCFPEEARVNFLKDALKWDEIEGLMAKVKSSFLGVTDALKSAWRDDLVVSMVTNRLKKTKVSLICLLISWY